MEYKYYIEGIEVFPKNDENLKYKYSKKTESALFVDINLESELQFNYISGLFNFKDQEEEDSCIELNFVVKRFCDGLTSIFFEGVFAVSEGKFDNDRCLFTIKPRKKESTQYDLEVNILYSPGTIRLSINTGVGLMIYEQGRKFGDVIDYVAKKANPNINSVISNFFQINPDGPFYLPGVTNYWQYMAFAPLSDIQNPIPSNLSIIANTTFQKLMDDLYVLFAVKWVIDSNFNLRVEHETYFEDVVGIDLTQAKYAKYIKATDKYEYDFEEIYKEENFKILNHTQSAQYRYGGRSSIAKQENSKLYSTSVISTDLTKILENGGGDTGSGLFLFATTGTDGDGIGGWSLLSLSLGENFYGVLAPKWLTINLHTYNRPDIYATFFSNHLFNPFNTAGGIILNSIKPTKKQTEISFPLCCDEVFDIKKKILTNLGEGFVEEATFQTKGSLLTTQLKYESINCNIISPDDLPGLQLWLKSGDLIKVVGNNNVLQWNDSSGFNRHAVQASPAAQPQSPGPIGTNSFVAFSTGQYLSTPAFQLFPNKRGTVIFLYRGNTPAAADTPLISTQNGGTGVYWDISFDINIALKHQVYGSVLPQNQDTGLGLKSNVGLMIVNRYDDVGEKTRQNSQDGKNGPLGIPNVQETSEPLILGANTNVFGNTNSDSSLNEIIIYDRDLSDIEMEKIEFYFVKKGIYTLYQ